MKTLFLFVAGLFSLGAAFALIFFSSWAPLLESGHLSDPIWAGTYHAGFHLFHHSLSITVAGRFTDTKTGCLQHDTEFGTVDDTGGRLRLKGHVASQTQNDSQEFLMVRWGKRRYLVPPEEILDFCAAVLGGCEPRDREDGNFLLQRGDEKNEPDSDEPHLPNGFQKYLRMKELDVGIKSLSKGSAPSVQIASRAGEVEPENHVTLDAGSFDGVLPGMRFYKPPPIEGGEVVIRETSEHESKGILTVWGPNSSPFAAPKIGDRFRAPSPWACSSCSSRVVPLAGRVTIDDHPPQKGGDIIVMLYDRNNFSRLSDRRFTVCRPGGDFSFSTYNVGDGAGVGTYVVVIAGLKHDERHDYYAGPDRFNNLYNDPDTNAERPGFMIKHKRPGKTDYVFNLKIHGVEPIKQPGPKALAEIKD